MTDLAPTRRQFISTLASAPLAGLPLAAVLADPKLAAAAAASLEPVSLTLPSGKAVNAALALPAQTPAPAVLLVHEWWGLNDQIKSVAAELAKQGYLALTVDLYDGKVTDQPDSARSYMQGVDSTVALETLVAWSGWLRQRSESTGKLGTVGWCFGGGWSLNTGIATPVDATVIYYGRVDRSVADLKRLRGPVIGHFASHDNWITADMVGQFEANMADAGKALTAYWYDAEHAFANPTNARYDQADAKLAWERTLAFYEENL